jgi:hypothetical protein
LKGYRGFPQVFATLPVSVAHCGFPSDADQHSEAMVDGPASSAPDSRFRHPPPRVTDPQAGVLVLVAETRSDAMTTASRRREAVCGFVGHTGDAIPLTDQETQDHVIVWNEKSLRAAFCATFCL